MCVCRRRRGLFLDNEPVWGYLALRLLERLNGHNQGGNIGHISVRAADVHAQQAGVDSEIDPHNKLVCSCDASRRP